MSTLFPTGDGSSAEFSACTRYRYALRRVWDPSLACCGWVMLNPSTADAREDDPTIRKCVGFAHRWGFGSIFVANLYAYRATNPREPRGVVHPEGAVRWLGPYNSICENDTWLGEAAKCDRLVFAWGAHATKDRADHVAAFIAERRTGAVECLGFTKGGMPLHPLMVAYATPLVDFWRGRAVA